MLRFIIRRLLLLVPVLVGLSVLLFIWVRALPGDPARALLGEKATPESIAEVNAAYGFDKPLVQQYLTYTSRLIRGDFGSSPRTGLPVLETFQERFPATVELAISALLFAIVLGIPIGYLAAKRAGGWVDRTFVATSLLGVVVPVFVLAYLLIWLVSLKLGWLPVQGYKRLADGAGAWFEHLLLPSITLSVIYVALLARVTRASVLETLGEDYIRTARAKGLPESAVLVRHALANAAVPILTVIGIGIALLIGGVVVTESVYAIPGLGRLTVDAVLARDFPTIQGVILLFSFVYVLVNMLVDVSYVFFDPRVRY